MATKPDSSENNEENDQDGQIIGLAIYKDNFIFQNL